MKCRTIIFAILSLFSLQTAKAETTKTIFNAYTGKFDFITTLSSTTLPAGSTQYIQNTSSLQSGATFYVSSGTAVTFVDQALSGNGTRCVQTDNTGLFSVASAACGSGGGGGSSSLQVTQSGVQITSPTASENFLGPPFIVTQVNTSTAQVTIDFSSITAQGNTHSIAQIAADTGTIEGQIGPLGASTGTIESQIGTLGASTGTIEGQIGTLGASTGTIETQIGTLGSSTGTIETQIATLGVSTGALQSGLNNVATSTTSIGLSTAALQIGLNNVATSTAAIALSTAALQSGLNNVITSTAAIGVSTGALQSGLNNVNVSTTAIGVSTGVIAGIVNSKVGYSSFSATTPILYNSGTGAISFSGQVAQSETFTSSDTITAPLGLGVTYGVAVGSITGAGLTTCGDATHALGFNSSNLFTCQSVTGSGGGGSSSLAVSTGSVIMSSPTPQIDFNPAQVGLSLNGTTVQVLILTSSFTAQGNTHSIAQIAADTGTIEGQIATLGVSTGALQSGLNNVATSTTSIGLSTAALQSGLNNVATSTTSIGLSTAALQSGLNNVATSTAAIALSTAALQSGLNNVITSTAAIGVSTGALQSGLNNVNVSTTAIGVSTGAIAGIVNSKVGYSSFSATAPILYNSGTGAISLSGQVAQSETFTSSVTLGAAVLVSSNVVLSNGQGTAGQVFTSGVTGAPSWTTPTVGGGGSSSLAMTTGTSAGFATVASSPTGVALFNSAQFSVSLQGNATGFVSALTSSITAQGNAFNGASQLVQTNGSTQLPAISGALLTNLSGGNIVTGIPTAVLPSTIAYLSSTNTWTGQNIFQSSAPTIMPNLLVTSGAVIPSLSQEFGRFTLNQWFSQMAGVQVSSGVSPVNQGKLSMFILGDSHFSTPYIQGPFTAWLNDNFGNAGSLFPLSDKDETNDSWRAPGCFFTKSGTWTPASLSPSYLGLGDDVQVAGNVGATITGQCPNSDQVTLYYQMQPSGGTIDFSVDGANHMTLPTTAATTFVASATISGLSYGVHTASITATAAGTVNVFDFMFFSSSTAGAVLYRVGTIAAQTVNYVAQDATNYQKFLGMLPSTPSVVLIALGVNDEGQSVSTTTYISNVRNLVGRFRAVYPNIDCAYLSEPDANSSIQGIYPMVSYETALLQASVNDNCAFIDFTALFSSQPAFSKYYTDNVHLNRAGGQVAAQLLINTFSNALFNITPFTVNTASSTVSYGTDISTAMFNNAAGVGLNVTYSTGLTNVGWLGNNLNLTKNNTLTLGGQPGSGVEQNVKVSTLTAASAAVTGSGGLDVNYGIVGSTLTLINSTSPNTLAISSVSTGIPLVAFSSSVAVNPTDFVFSLGTPTAPSPLIWGVQLSGHVISSGTVPTVSSCGTTPTINSGSTDTSGRVTWAGIATACTVTFVSPFSANPFCVGISTGPAVGVAQPTATTGPVFSFSGITGGTLTYHCEGGSGG